MKFQLKSNVMSVIRNYRGIGMGTPFATINKCSMLLDKDYTCHKVAIVVIDAIRSSTTLLACFSAGVEAATIMIKGGEKGTPTHLALHIAKQLNLQMVSAGEINGLPMSGCIIGNCPSEAAACAELKGKFLHFQSTNFGSTFSEVVASASEFRAIGGYVEIFVASFANAEVIAKNISLLDFDRVLISCSGYYDNLSIEDNIVAGKIIQKLNFSIDELDDEARVMLILFRAFNTKIKQYNVLKSNWISRSLTAFQKENDVKTVLWGEGITLPRYKLMKQLIPMVEWVGNIPLIVIRNSFKINDI